MRLMRRLRDGEVGSALITALIATFLMLALGLALLSIVDTQANESADERTRDRSFNLSESVLNSYAFVLGRNWPSAAPTPNPSCAANGAGFADTIGTPGLTSGLTVAGAVPTNGNALPGPLQLASAPLTATTRLRPNLNASYTDVAYDDATWQVNVCDDIEGSTVWDAGTLLSNKTYDLNDNDKVWVRAQSTVAGKTRTVTGLVEVRKSAAQQAKYGLVAGNVSEDLGALASTITNTSLTSSLTGTLLSPAAPPVLPDPLYPLPASGVTGVRCGLLENITEVKTCVKGAIGAAAHVPLVNTLVNQDRFEQYPSQSSTTADAIGQLRTQAKTSPGVYMQTALGANTAAAAPSCAITGATADSVVFIEKVGTGDQYCYVDVSTSVTYKALVIGSGRVVIRGTDTITPYDTATTNRLTGVIYALNLQTTDHSASTPTREVIRIEKGARVKGATHADGKNATIGLVAPEFDTDALVNALIPCSDLATCALRTTLKALGISALVNELTSGSCLLRVLTCVVPGPSVSSVLASLTTQLSGYGSAIRSDVATIEALTVYGASGVTPGTFRDLQSR